MNYEVPYGLHSVSFELPAEWHAEVLAPRDAPAVRDARAEVTRALLHPVTEVDLPSGRDVQVAIAVNDKTRPVPHDFLLPPLVEMLERRGIPDGNITFVIATGTHPVMELSEFPSILPADILRRFRVVCHDAYDEASLVSLGATRRGTPAVFNRIYAEADLRIVVGNVEPHQFMGYSGGVKSAAIGVAGAKTVSSNHSLMMDRNARLGVYEENPARQDVEELGRILGVHYALNAVLNGHKDIVRVFAGDPVAVVTAAIPFVRRQFEVEVDEPFDLVIASPGGHPKDINLYQAQKALAHASLVTRDGGVVVLVAACPEGSGSPKYDEWVRMKRSHQDVIRGFDSEGFHIGAHKAFQIARDAVRVNLYVCSDMPEELTRSYLLQGAQSVEDAVSRAMHAGILKKNARVGIMPYANATIPRIV